MYFMHSCWDICLIVDIYDCVLDKIALLYLITKTSIKAPRREKGLFLFFLPSLLRLPVPAPRPPAPLPRAASAARRLRLPLRRRTACALTGYGVASSRWRAVPGLLLRYVGR